MFSNSQLVIRRDFDYFKKYAAHWPGISSSEPTLATIRIRKSKIKK